MVSRYIPEAGDIVWVDFSPTKKGHEQSGRRPAVVISIRPIAKVNGLCTVCPITSQSKGYTNEVSLSVKGIVGVVLVDQYKTIDVFARPLTKVAQIPAAVLINIRRRIGIVLGIIS